MFQQMTRLCFCLLVRMRWMVSERSLQHVRYVRVKIQQWIQARLPNSTVLYPDGWYSAKGGTKPQHPATFEEALARGKINWLAEE